jgi:fumarate reductase subunit C
MSDQTAHPNATSSSVAAPHTTVAYPHHQPPTWWLRNRRYLLYMLREFSAVPIVLWMVWFLVEIAGLRQGSRGYQPLGGPLFIAASVVCLGFALLHSFTFLSLAGKILRIPMGDRDVPPRVIVSAVFSALVLLTAVIAGLLIWGGQ